MGKCHTREMVLLFFWNASGLSYRKGVMTTIYLFIAYYVSGPVLGSGDSMKRNTDNAFTFQDL